MEQVSRYLDLKSDLAKKSLFLFGPRQTGKTSLLKQLFPQAPTYNLLLADVFLKLSQRPQLMREELLLHAPGPWPVVVDEIQKLPILLDEVHHLIEAHRLRFVLTGSSPRKLKRGGANLLAGRAWEKQLFPLASVEIPKPDLLRILNFGSLPAIYFSETPEKDLSAYVGTYLQEEIKAEGLTRKVENFSRFLQTAALCDTQQINFSNIAQDAAVPPRTVIEYFSILQDTLLGCLLEPFAKTKKRKAVSTAKFYFFDVGVSNLLAGRKNIKPKTELFGSALEHFIFTELRAFLRYTEDGRTLSFWRSTSDHEVDFLIGDEVAIEVKGTEMAHERHLSGIQALSEDLKLKQKIVVSMDSRARKIGDITVYPVMEFLHRLWAKEF